jgi:hypothetical protein
MWFTPIICMLYATASPRPGQLYFCDACSLDAHAPVSISSSAEEPVRFRTIVLLYLPIRVLPAQPPQLLGRRVLKPLALSVDFLIASLYNHSIFEFLPDQLLELWLVTLPNSDNG